MIFERFDFLLSKAHFPADVFHEITWTTDELKRNVYEQNIIIILVFKIIIHRALKSGIRTLRSYLKLFKAMNMSLISYQTQK